MTIDDEQVESCNFLSFGSGFVVRFLSLKDHCSLNKYLNPVALPLIASPSLSVECCLELATKVKKDFFTGSLRALKCSLCPKNEVLLKYFIFFDQSFGAIWFLIHHQKGLPI